MPVSDNFRAFALEQLGRVAAEIRARRMFGGVGIYSGADFFALLDDDALFLKADGESREAFLQAGMQPFRPFGDDAPMQYYEIPGDILEDADALAPWVASALAAARRKHATSPRASKPRTTSGGKASQRPKRR